jgi:hypothetical protein
MRATSLLVLPLFISVCVAPIAAQSSPNKIGAVRTESQTSFPNQSAAGNSVTLALNNGPCYLIRSYRFTQDKPVSDSTKFASYSTCQPVKQFQMKSAVDVHPR